jgi:diguanylate cyclase (GGDEF)-like protein
LAISNFSSYQKAYGQLASEAVLKKVSSCLVNSFQGVERAGRFGDYEFAVIAPEINKRQAENLAENLQIRVGQLLKEESKTDMSLSLSAAVAENPLDGISSAELIACARARLSL